MRKEGAKSLAINTALRAWTRGTSFTLAMGKTQVATLIAVAVSAEQRDLIGRSAHPFFRCFVTAVNGLIDRGLVQHFPWKTAQEHSRRTKYREFYAVTEAGEHVVALLKITGIFAEIEAELLAADAKAPRVRIA